MTFLPIVERELRVAARKRFTFWLRVIAATVALAIGGGYFLLMTVTTLGGVRTVGGPLFGILTWLSFAVALSVGLFFTSDCLSEEKREGTLGFLFLTDLRGFDVVLGKLCATSLRAAFALLAVFPILAVTLLLGGVEPGQFWRTMLALMNATFFSLATGMLVSAISRNGQKALAGTLILLALWTFGGMAADGVFAVIRERPLRAVLGLASPLQVFRAAEGWSGSFWLALLVSQLVAWLQMVLAGVCVRRNWQDGKPESDSTTRRVKGLSWWRHGGEKRRLALRVKWLERDPMLWLALRERGTQTYAFFWPAVFVAGVVLGIYQLTGGEMWVLWNFLSGAISLVVYLAVASQAAQFFAEARRTRLLELLLASPLDACQIVMGPWRALVRQFAGLVVLLILIHLVGWVFSVSAISGLSAPRGVNGTMLLTMALIGAIVTVANLAAVGWFGLCMGMTSRNALLATLKTIVFVQIAPWFAITIASGLLVPIVLLPTLMKTGAASTSAAWFSTWYPLLIVALKGCLALGKDFLFWRWSRRKLMQDFREQATRVVAPVVIQTAAAKIPAPPIIPTRQ